MSQPEFNIPNSFDGSVRLFPLSNVVLFPGVVQALNLFEPRYRQLMSDVIKDDQLITMALVKPDHGNLSMPVPEICQTVCVGKIVTHAKLDDGAYNLLLAGISRAVIVEEFVSDTPYRQAKVKLIPETPLLGEDEQGLKAKLVELFRNSQVAQSKFERDAIEKLETDKMPVGQLGDLVAYASGISHMDQQAVLEIVDIRERINYLISVLQRHNQSQSPPDFPPDFSMN